MKRVFDVRELKLAISLRNLITYEAALAIVRSVLMVYLRRTTHIVWLSQMR